MKNHVRLALLCMAAAAVPAFAQTPQCGSTNYDAKRQIFTVMNAPATAVNQQCYITVYPAGAMPAAARQSPGSYFPEGRYAIELSGGGGGGGGGAGGSKDMTGGGGGGGASAARSRTVQYLAPGVYKLTLGTGGEGGRAQGGRTESGNPTSVTKADTGQLVAGFPGADVAAQRTVAAGSGQGGVAQAGASSGGSGGASTPSADESSRSGQAGGSGGGSGVGRGGGGGSSGQSSTAQAGSQGGHGFVKLALLTAAVGQAPAAAPAVVQREPAAPVARPTRRDRN